MTMTAHDQSLLTSALRGGSDSVVLTARQRVVIRKICASVNRREMKPEQILIEFKQGLVNAADGAGIGHGSEREELIARLVTGFIDELYRENSRGPAFELPSSDGASAGFR